MSKLQGFWGWDGKIANAVAWGWKNRLRLEIARVLGLKIGQRG
jgi:hypothetical protein